MGDGDEACDGGRRCASDKPSDGGEPCSGGECCGGKPSGGDKSSACDEPDEGAEPSGGDESNAGDESSADDEPSADSLQKQDTTHIIRQRTSMEWQYMHIIECTQLVQTSRAASIHYLGTNAAQERTRPAREETKHTLNSRALIAEHLRPPRKTTSEHIRRKRSHRG